jgi:hypothetical protein
MAFLITYHEYAKHKLQPLRVWKEALLAAGVAFLGIVGLSSVAAYALGYLSGKSG